MPKYIIMWDYGYGETHDIIEAENHDRAEHEAYTRWKEDAESQANYSAVEYSDQLAWEAGLIEDDPDEEE